MPSVKDIKLRIRAVRNTQQITKAMKMVAAARIKRAEVRVRASRPYTEKMGEMVQNLVGLTEEPHPFFVQRPVKKRAVLLVTADKGLCGSYNSNIIRVMQNFLSSHNDAEVVLLTVGNKGKQFFQRRGLQSQFHFTPSFYPEFKEAQEIAQTLMEKFLSGEWDEIWLLYTRFISAMTQKPAEKQLLPFLAPPSTRSGEFLFEPDPQTVLASLLPQYLSVLVYNVLVEARAAELGARLVAMGNATDNAKKLIDALTLQFYRARQESITREILEVASGAEALKG
jgi:F-type H+-transporting ATPase subunit gamma